MDTFQHIVDKQMAKYNERWEVHGDSHLALGWPDEAMNHKRFEKMYGIVNENRFHGSSATLLDFGCGLGHFKDWLDKELKNDKIYLHWNVQYTGLDANPNFKSACEKKYRDTDFYGLNVLDDRHFDTLPEFDYIICNGVFTEKLDTPQPEQWSYFTEIIKRLWKRTRHGIAFNVMGAHPDQLPRTDLFDVSFGDMARFIRENLSDSFVFHHDYNPWEYTTYVYR